MIVRQDNFLNVVGSLSVSGSYGLDTETTGLHLSDRIFSIIIANFTESFYFSFNDEADHLGGFVPEEYRLPRHMLDAMAVILENPESKFFIHNAKFDLGMLAKEGLEVLGTVHCTEALERVLNNNYLGHKPYSLATCAKRRGWEKDDSVEKYIKANKLITKTQIPGKEKPEERWHFNKVPFDIISRYGERDAYLHRAIGVHQLAELQRHEEAAPISAPSMKPLVDNEYKLTKAFFRMERTGIPINRPYVEGALAYTQKCAASAKQSFEEMTGIPYQDSATVLKKAFAKMHIELPLTRTGQPCTNKEVLDALDNPLANKIREIRGHEKLCSTYYSSFLYYADSNDLIHANMRQGGTETSRISYSNPNLQNLPKEDEDDDRLKAFIVRRSFRPISEDFCFVPIDFKQQEFRMMLDYAGECEMIDAVMGGMDVHEATAQFLGVSRKHAKTLNFGLLYGMGAAKLAKGLKITLVEAHELRALYFEKLPRVKKLIRGVMNNGASRGYIWNWFGFRNHLSAPEYAYVLPNHLIQGGCGQVIRVATTRLDDYIRANRLRSQMLAQVHDEILFQVHRSELAHVEQFQRIMESVYTPRNGLYLHCSVEHSWESWGKFDQRPGAPVDA